MNNEYLEPQPEPQIGYGDVWMDVVYDFKQVYDIESNKILHSHIVKDMIDRRNFGIAKYGVQLQYGNKRNPLFDAYQQLLDFLVYIKQYLVQNKNKEDFKYKKSNHVYYRILKQLVNLRKQIQEE